MYVFALNLISRSQGIRVPETYSATLSTEASSISTNTPLMTLVPRGMWYWIWKRKTTVKDAPISIQNQTTEFSPPKGPSFAARPLQKDKQLERYIIEIVAFTFGVDFDELNAALYHKPVQDHTTSILCEAERNDLLRLSESAKELIQKSVRNEINTCAIEDKKAAYYDIILPAENFPTMPDKFALDIISSYTDHQCDPARWNNTVVGYWNTNPEREYYKHRDIKSSLRSHACLIAAISPNEKVQRVLGAALEQYQKERKFEGFELKYIYWPLRPGCDATVTMLGNEVYKLWMRDYV